MNCSQRQNGMHGPAEWKALAVLRVCNWCAHFVVNVWAIFTTTIVEPNKCIQINISVCFFFCNMHVEEHVIESCSCTDKWEHDEVTDETNNK